MNILSPDLKVKYENEKSLNDKLEGAVGDKPIVPDNVINVPLKPDYYRIIDDINFKFESRYTVQQFVIINNSTSVIKVATDEVTATRYDHIINVNKMYVSPPFNFQILKFLLAPFVATEVKPVLYVYRNGVLTPGVYAL